MATASSGREDVTLTALACGVALAGLSWVTAAASAVVCGHPVPGWRPFAGLVAFAHPGEPSVAWHAAVGPAAIYWTCTTLVFAVGGVAAYTGWQLLRRLDGAAMGGRHSPVGLAARAEVQRAAGTRSLCRRVQVLRPGLERTAPGDLGFWLGRSHGVDCWVSWMPGGTTSLSRGRSTRLSSI